jgi:hypothetical protein
MTTPTKQAGRPLEITDDAIDALGYIVDGQPLLAAADRVQAREVLAAIGPHLVCHELRCLAYDLHEAAPRTARLLDARANQIDGGEVAS